MNTHDKIELPPLPVWQAGKHAPETLVVALADVRPAIQDAIEADRKRRGDPVAAYQIRSGVGEPWQECDFAAFDIINRTRPGDARRLYAAPQPMGTSRGEPECNHCGGTGDVSGEYPGMACSACAGTGKAPQPAEPSHINLLSEAKKFLDSYEDQGPYGEGWKSSELESLIEKIDAAIKAQSAEPSGSDPVAWLRSDQLRKLGRPYSDSPVNQRTDSMLLSAKGTPEAAAQYGHNVPVYAAPQPTEHSIDYKELYEQMCERCDHLDAKLAEYEHHSESVAWPRVNGISRDVHPRCLTLYLADTPTNDQMRAIHDTLRQAPQPAEPVEVPSDAWEMAEKVRRDLDRQSCPDAFMRIAVQSVVKHFGQPAQPAASAEPRLYQHSDGRYGLSFGPAKFAKGEPAWYSVPIDVYEGPQ